MRAKIARGAVVAVLAALATGGCRQIVGVDDRPQAPVCGGLSFADASCAECMQTACCAEANACSGAAGCSDFSGCVAACPPGDAACTSGCRARTPTGYGAAASSLQSCEALHCASACQLTCGGYVYPEPACGACATTHCCDAASACMIDSDCAVLAACERECVINDDACLQKCELAHPDGVAHERALGACLHTACAASCITPKWACLEHITPPPASGTGPPINVTYTFIGYETAAPVRGLNVRACGKTDTQCHNPFPPVPTSARGQAVVPVGYNFFDGYAEITGAGYATVLLFFPPLAKDFVSEPLAIFPQARLTDSLGALAPLRPDRASLIVRVHDCTGAPAGGVRLAIEPSDGSTPFYFVGGLPSLSATATDDGYYTGGYAGFVNVKANTLLTVRATANDSGLSLAPGTAVARPGTGGYTELMMYATPP